MGLTEAIKDVKTWKQVLVILFLIFAVWFVPKFLDYLNNNDEREYQKWEKIFEQNNQIEERKNDSIIKEQLKAAKQAVINNSLIFKELDKLSKNIKHAGHITIFKVHDHGGVPTTGEPLRLTVLYSEVSDSKNIEEDWQSRSLPSGYGYFISNIAKDGKSYIREARKDSVLYVGKSKEYMNYVNTHSLYGIYLGAGTDGTYYLAASFDKVLDYKDSYNNRLIMDYSARELKKLISFKLTKSD